MDGQLARDTSIVAQMLVPVKIQHFNHLIPQYILLDFGSDQLRGPTMSQEYRTAKSTAKCTGMKWKQAQN